MSSNKKSTQKAQQQQQAKPEVTKTEVATPKVEEAGSKQMTQA